MVVYRKLLRSLTLLFFALSLLTLPAIMTYFEGNGYNQVVYDNSKYAKLSLGNMGFKSDQCAFTPLTMGKLYMNCEYGNITKMIDYGINSYQIPKRDACVNSANLNNTGCSGILDETYMNDQFEEFCHGKTSCYIKTMSESA